MLAISSLTAIFNSQDPAPSSASIDLAYWKWVIIIGAVAVVVFYAIKRIADVVVKKKTDAMIRNVVGEDADTEDRD